MLMKLRNVTTTRTRVSTVVHQNNNTTPITTFSPPPPPPPAAAAAASTPPSSSVFFSTAASSSPSLNPPFIFQSWTASAASLPSPPQSSSHPAIINAYQAKQVAASVKEWFRSRSNAALDRIFSILSSDPHGDDGLDPTTTSSSYSSSRSASAADAALSRLGLPLTEAFVLEVLRYGANDVLSCLKFFDWAGHQLGFQHTPATFHAILKIMSRAKLVSLMLDFLDKYLKGTYVYMIRFHSVLVMGYAIAGRPEIALQLFGRMRFQGLDLDALAYHVLLNALVDQHWFDAVRVVSRQISLRGFESKYTHSILVKSLCKQNRLEDGEAFIRGLLSDGRQPLTGSMVGHLVDGFCRSKQFAKAGRLVEEFRDLGMVESEHCYAAWIRNLVQVGNVDGALEFLHTRMESEGYVPNVFRYNSLICRFLRENQLEEVWDLFIEMREIGLAPDKVTMNAALCLFCKAGMVDVALELYRSRSEFGLSPNSMAYNYLIGSLCRDGSIDEAYSVLRNSIDQGYFPGRRTFTILANALCGEGKIDKMKELVVAALDHNVMPSASIYNKFISALCKASEVENGYLIHGMLNSTYKVASRYTYSNLIHSFNKSNRGDIAARLLTEMQEKGHSPNRVLFRGVIMSLCEMENPEKQFFDFLKLQVSHHGHTTKIYNFFIDGAGHAKKPDLAREAYEIMGRSGVVPNLSSDILMLQSYLVSNRISDALSFFDDLSKRRKIRRKLYNTMIVGLCRVKKPELALKILLDMKENKVTPSLECYEELVKLFCSTEEYDKVVYLVDDMEKINYRVSSFIGNTLLWHSLKCKKLYKAWVESKCQRSETSYQCEVLGRLIGEFSGCTAPHPRIEDLEEAIEQCFPLNIYTYNMLLTRLSKGHMGRAYDLFVRLSQKGYEPNQWTYSILAYGFFRQNKVSEAKRWVEEMFRGRSFPIDGKSVHVTAGV